MMLDYYELISSLRIMIAPKMNCRWLWTGYNIRPTHNATHCKTVLGPENIPDMMSWVYHNDAGLIWNPIHSLCMMIGPLQYYCQLATKCRIVRYSQYIAIQAAVFELVMVWPRDSNPRSYYFKLSTLYQILRDSQWITNQATVCELNTIWPRDSNPTT